MAFDNSRYTFNATNDYSGVVMQQGRVQLDSDWNEWLAELARRTQAGTLDTLGRAVYPATTPFAFQITLQAGPTGAPQLLIGPGRLYVDGLLAENHGTPATAVWDPALAEPSNAPQPPPPAFTATTGAIDYTSQPYLPNTPAPPGKGTFLAYLDVWTRAVTALQDPDLIDVAVGIDTTGRLQTVWQVKLLSGPTTCGAPVTWPSSAGLLSTGVVSSTPAGPCCLSSETGYTGQENQLYRVEIHQGGPLPGRATFKWSRENASVLAGVTGIQSTTSSQGAAASLLTVTSLGRDQVLGFAPGNWIEILDDTRELNGQPGELHQIDSIDFSARTLTLVTALAGTFATDGSTHTRIRRWDQSGKVYQSDGTTVWWDLGASAKGDIPVPPSGTTLILENGITVAFDLQTPGGSFLSGDFWSFAARTADGSVETLAKAPPRGIHHHYTPLAIVTFPQTVTDCRTPWPTSTGTAATGACGCCCSVTVGDGVNSHGQFTAIGDALKALPAQGGEICVLPGLYHERVLIAQSNVVIRGCGPRTRIASPQIVIFAQPAAAQALSAVITVGHGLRDVTLEDFAVEAADGDVGILLDGTGRLAAQSPAAAQPLASIGPLPSLTNTTLAHLTITSSTLPAVLAAHVQRLGIEDSRIAMANVPSLWPAVWVSGTQIRICRNWIGTQGTAAAAQWLPAIVAADIAAAGGVSTPSTPAQNPGGIQIAGPSQDVEILDNQIEDSGRNGISLGSLEVDVNGTDSGTLLGVLTTAPGQGALTLLPGAAPIPGGTVVAGAALTGITIARNVIRNTGLCGIGPVALFDLTQTSEAISLQNLTLEGNTIASTVQAAAAPLAGNPLSFGYGAICLPDVQNLTLRDNAITDFGASPGLAVCGIYILHAQMATLSRNQVLETRDWSVAGKDGSGGGLRAGIYAQVSPPTATRLTGTQATTVSETTLPALRMEGNTVRVALPQALVIEGSGPFSIVNNHFACGGGFGSEAAPLAKAVQIINAGPGLDTSSTASSFVQTFTSAAALPTLTPTAQDSGTVLFSDNICHLEARALLASSLSSVFILTLDALIFSGNHCWVDSLTSAQQPPVWVDALLAGATLQVIANRFQETPGRKTTLSATTVGLLNVTSQNISTQGLQAQGLLQPAQAANNLTLL